MTISAEPSVLQLDDTGTIRIGATRVTLDSLIAAFSLGATAEQIAQDYPSLNLAEVYAAIAYYLRHRNEMDEYLARRKHASDDFRSANPDLYPAGIRERLMARSNASQVE